MLLGFSNVVAIIRLYVYISLKLCFACVWVKSYNYDVKNIAFYEDFTAYL